MRDGVKFPAWNYYTLIQYPDNIFYHRGWAGEADIVVQEFLWEKQIFPLRVKQKLSFFSSAINSTYT